MQSENYLPVVAQPHCQQTTHVVPQAKVKRINCENNYDSWYAYVRCMVRLRIMSWIAAYHPKREYPKGQIINIKA